MGMVEALIRGLQGAQQGQAVAVVVGGLVRLLLMMVIVVASASVLNNGVDLQVAIGSEQHGSSE